MNPEDKKKFDLIVSKRICRGLSEIKPGDIISVDTQMKIVKGQFCLVSFNENQWICRFKSKLPDHNYYAITKVKMMS